MYEDWDESRVQISQRQSRAMNAKVSQVTPTSNAEGRRHLNAFEVRHVVANGPGYSLCPGWGSGLISAKFVHSPCEIKKLIARRWFTGVNHAPVMSPGSGYVGRKECTGNVSKGNSSIVCQYQTICPRAGCIPSKVCFWIANGPPTPPRFSGIPTLPAFVK